MTEYVDLCAVEDVANGKHRAFVVDGRSILLFRINSDFFAIENRCSHLQRPLLGGRQIGFQIICPAHGGRFDVRTGQAVGSPAVDPVSCFDVRVHEGRVELGVA